MEHKYSTWALLFVLGIGVFVVLVDAIDGYGTAQSIPKFIYGDVLGNSSIIDDLNTSLIFTSSICTSTNGLCASNGSGTINNTYYVNTTINNTYYVNTTINITQNSTTGVKNFTVTDVDNTVTHTLCLLNGTCLFTEFTDSTGGSYSAGTGLILTSTTFSVNSTYIESLFGNPFNQVLNTTSSVNFSNVTVSNCYYFLNSSNQLCHNPSNINVTEVPGNATITPLEDLSGNGFNLTQPATGCYFNQTGQSIFCNSTANTAKLSSPITGDILGTQFTISTMIRYISQTDYTRLYDMEFTGQNGFLVQDEGNPNYFFRLVNRTGGSAGVYGSGSWTTTKWYHLLITVNATHIMLYVDGSMPNTPVAKPPNWNVTQTKLDIARTFIGSLDNMTIYNRSTPLTEILSLNTTRGVPSNYTGLVAYYPMNNQTGSAGYNITTGIQGTLDVPELGVHSGYVCYNSTTRTMFVSNSSCEVT